MMGKSRKGTIAFRVIYGLLTIAAIVIIAVVLKTLWDFLQVYEKCQPELAIKAYTKEMTSMDKLPEELENVKLNEYEDREALTKYIDSLMDGEIVYKRNGKESDGDTTVYDIKVNENVIARATVVPSPEDAGFGMHEYVVSDVRFGQVNLSSCTVTAPSNATVFFGDKAVDKKYITKKGTPYKDTEYFHGYFEGEIYDVTYKVDGFLYQPEITVKDSFGNELEMKDGKYVLSAHENNELTRFALEFAQNYSKFVVNDGYLSTVTEYLAPDMPLLEELQTFENTWHNYHTDYDFIDVDAGEPLFYNENCAAVKISYDHVLYGVQSSENGELHSKADYTVYLVNTDGNWLVTDLRLN